MNIRVSCYVYESTPLCTRLDAPFAPIVAALRALRSLRTLVLAACAISGEELALVHSVIPEGLTLHTEPRGGWRCGAAWSAEAAAARLREVERLRAWAPEAVRRDEGARALWQAEEAPLGELEDESSGSPGEVERDREVAVT